MRTSTFEDEDIGVLAEDLDVVEQALIAADVVRGNPKEER